MSLPNKIQDAKVLITVKTYPRPTPSYEETVCTAGVMGNGKWVRIYPIPFRDLPYSQQFEKFRWIQLNLEKELSDDRPESYKPQRMFDEEIIQLKFVDTKNDWNERKRLVLKEVFESMEELIDLAYQDEKKSLAVLKPSEIQGFEIEKVKDRNWDKRYVDRLAQMKLFGPSNDKQIIKKLPYNFYYKFLTADNKSRRLKILDWEIGALYWNCLSQTGGDEDAANELVKRKYFDEFTEKKELYFFLGTTYQFHKKKVLNPFTIVGVFPPPKTQQLSLKI